MATFTTIVLTVTFLIIQLILSLFVGDVPVLSTHPASVLSPSREMKNVSTSSFKRTPSPRLPTSLHFDKGSLGETKPGTDESMSQLCSALF